MLSGRGAGAAGPVVFFEIAAVGPLTLTFRFNPDMLRMGPAPNFGLPNAEWGASGEWPDFAGPKSRESGYIGLWEKRGGAG